MKKTFVILVTVALLGILAASVAQPQKATPKTSIVSTPAVATSPPSVAPTVTPATQSPASTATAATAGQYKDGHYTGTAASNRYDTIQVAVTISGGKMTAIDTPTLEGDSDRSYQINSYAIPQLKSQAISSQSSTIDGISGASYTTEAYVSSLQSALDQAKV